MQEHEERNNLPRYEHPRPFDPQARCYWYHSQQFPDGERVRGSWTIDDFTAYIGGFALGGKSVLDVGTASGYLAFNAEKAGATVTALDAATTHEFRHFPFAESLSFQDVKAYRAVWESENLAPIKNSWWYAWNKFGSSARCVYAPMIELYEWPAQMFDVVMAGAIVEHLSDPVFAIGAWARLAKDAVLIPFTDVLPTHELMMRPITPLDDSRINYVWWHLSRGLYDKIFDNLGFDVHYTLARAEHHDAEGGSEMATRPSIIALRRGSDSARTFDTAALIDPVRPALAPTTSAAAPNTRRRGLLRRLLPR
ncbi:O-methyltransferase [Methylobacterium phyllostachyos]|uniref:O-methyltransferase n=1 Tax=Methylobacterium phyllostachyos TaxID=582672 RepID=A0A1G9WKC6_9HYPH|nr:methyltransferase domain-containing protein [Methylobacterium phyllostachyos]SDM84998.1 O-methyltransferase [Methylobacterium phyllostachyos]